MNILIASRNYLLASQIVDAFDDVEIVGVTSSYLDTLDQLRLVTEGKSPKIDAVLLSDDLDGARDRLSLPPMTLSQALLQARQLAPAATLVVLSTRGTAVDSEIIARVGLKQISSDVPAAPGSAIQEVLGLRARDEVARVYTMAGLLGGAGRSTMAINMAAMLAADEAYRGREYNVLLWDLDLHSATIGRQLGITAADRGMRSLSGLLTAENPADMSAINRHIMLAKATRLEFDLLLGPEGLRETLSLFRSNDDLHALHTRLTDILRRLRYQYRAIVFDTGTDLLTSRLPISAMAASSVIAILANGSVPGIVSLEHIIEALSDAGWTKKTRIILNRHSGREQDTRNIETSFGIDVVGDLGYQPSFQQAEREQRILIRERSRKEDELRRTLTRLTEVD